MSGQDNSSLPPDYAARKQALQIDQSFIVQAPAGSGKTELLIQRILSLLAIVDQPEEILAITFTRKAAAEMQQRLLKAIERAGDVKPPAEVHERETWKRATHVLARDEQKGWNLLANPSRLQIMTIDSFCSSLSRRMPWLTRLGDQPGISEDPDKLYRQAAESLLESLETGGAGQRPVSIVLRHLDNRLDRLRDLLVNMLSRRDQWLRHVVSGPADLRPALERSLQSYIGGVLNETYSRLGASLFDELLELGIHAAGQLADRDEKSPLRCLLDSDDFDPVDFGSLDKWLGLCHLILTADNSMRKTVNKSLGFGAEKSGDAPLWKERMLQLLAQLGEQGLERSFAVLRDLPFARYKDEQWQILEALIKILPLAVVELWSVFRQSGRVDFIEVANAALNGLGATEAPGDLLLKLDASVSHILVDEFQDTSYTQYELLRKLTSGWEQGDGRTLFVVGDPMQSIYLFREADVGLFLQVRQQGLNGIVLTPLTLSANFRSQSGLIEWFNATFNPLFPEQEMSLTGAVSYSLATSVRDSRSGPAVTTHFLRGQDESAEADAVLALIEQAKKEFPDGSCAVLVRSRAHLEQIVTILNANSIPYQAQDVDSLKSRSVINDLLALTRSLLQPCDRVAWLALLRARWAGLFLSDLLFLSDHDKKSSILARLGFQPLQQDMFSELSDDAKRRIERILPVLEHARQQRGRVSLDRLVRSTWQALGGPACVDSQDLEDAEQFFVLLRELDDGGDLQSLPELVSRLERLFAAPDPKPGNMLQLMTVHKAKGLEFDTVILPGLGRGIRNREKQLLHWLEQPDLRLLLAPIPPVTGEDDATYRAIGTILQQREKHETLRLLYVAATRSRERLHLLGHVNKRKEEWSPQSGSLLHVLWPNLGVKETDLLMTESQDEDGPPLPSIKRLPGNWKMPELQSVPAIRNTVIARPSEAVQGFSEERSFTLRSREGRVVGTLVHRWLERIAAEGVDNWNETSVKDLKPAIFMQLTDSGIIQSRLEESADKIMKILIKSLSSKVGLWILGDRDEAECELALSGIIDGQLIHATIDRTFIEGNVRWVVDYKTTIPSREEELDDFLTKEMEKYRSQIEIYSRLIAEFDPLRKVKGALYFPAIDAWKELI